MENTEGRGGQAFRMLLAAFAAAAWTPPHGGARRAERPRPGRPRLGALVAPSGRNKPCPCGSGKKWKRCCGRRRRP